jgi:hypothetical protein
MSIDFLLELENSVNSGKVLFACPGAGEKQWMISSSIEELRKHAKRAANNKKMAIGIVRLIPKGEVMSGEHFLVPVSIDKPGSRGEPQIKWSTVETKEAAEMMRDMRQGPSPYFGMLVEESVKPAAI